MRLVTMEGNADCAAACVAMVLGLQRASQVYPLLGYNPNTCEPQGTTDVEVIALLNGLGKHAYEVMARESISAELEADCDYRKALPTKKALRARLGEMQKGFAIVSVPAHSNPELLHYVVCYKGEAYDPNRGAGSYIGAASSLPAISAIFVGTV